MHKIDLNKREIIRRSTTQAWGTRRIRHHTKLKTHVELGAVLNPRLPGVHGTKTVVVGKLSIKAKFIARIGPNDLRAKTRG